MLTTPYYLSNKQALRYHQGKAEKHFGSAASSAMVGAIFFRPGTPARNMTNALVGGHAAVGAVHLGQTYKQNRKLQKSMHSGTKSAKKPRGKN